MILKGIFYINLEETVMQTFIYFVSENFPKFSYDHRQERVGLKLNSIFVCQLAVRVSLLSVP